MKAITRHIPNTITSLNLFSGCLAIVFAFRQQLDVAAYLIFAAAIFDFCDGFAARLLKAYSPLGLQLDSLADMVSFGVAPSVMLHVLLNSVLDVQVGEHQKMLISFIPFVLAVFSALRLAKFNIDTRQSESFIGLPTPACTLLIASAILAGSYSTLIYSVITNCWVIIVSVAVLSFLLVSEIPMFSLKFKKQENRAAFFKKYSIQLIFLVACLISPIIFGVFCIGAMILLYILISVALWLTKPKAMTASKKKVKKH